MIMRLTEEEKKQILSKYVDDTSDELLNHLKRHFPVHEVNFDWMKQPIKLMQIDDRTTSLSSNKKYLVGKIYHIVEDDWSSLGEQKIRRTIKKYLDGVMAS